MDTSQITVENVAAVIGVGIVSAWLAARKYLAQLKAPPPTAANGDMIIPGLTIADMQPIRDLETDQERMAEAGERIAAALEKMLLLSQERAEDAEIVRRAEIMAQEMLKELQPVAPRRGGR